jgi:hypothetical protein
LMGKLERMAESIRTLRLPKAAAMSLVVMIFSGCAAMEKAGGGISSGSEWLFGYGLPIGGSVLGLVLVIGGILNGLPRRRLLAALKHARQEKRNADSTFNVDVDHGQLSQGVMDAREEIDRLADKIDNAHNSVVLGTICGLADELYGELTRGGHGPRRAQITRISNRLSEEIRKIHIPRSQFWTWGNGLKLAGAILLLTTAIAWAVGAAGGSGTSDESGLERIPVGNTEGAGSTGATDGNTEIVVEEPSGNESTRTGDKDDLSSNGDDKKESSETTGEAEAGEKGEPIEVYE